MDLDSFFTAVKQQFKKELPFVVYRKPNKETIRAIFQNDDKLYVTSSYREQGFVFAPFDTDLNAIIFPMEKCKVYSSFYLHNATKTILNNNSLELTQENESAKHKHQILVEKGIDAIQSNQLKKVVLSRKTDIKINFEDENKLIQLIEKMLNGHPTAFVYCWYHPNVGLWMGATPESLFSLENKTFRTMALAGTQKFEEDTKVVWSEKEREEQTLVTDFLEKALEKVVPILMVSKPVTLMAGNVIHLKTDVGGTINTRLCDIPCLIKKLHPTPAVCGFPKEKAMNFIKENENHDREFYSGFLGELNFNHEIFDDKRGIKESYADFYVNLRCMKISNNIATLFVGGGITKDSNPVDEWKETVLKANTMLQILS